MPHFPRRPKKPGPLDLAKLMEAFLKKKKVPKEKLKELQPAIALFAQQRNDLARVQTNNIRACDLLHKYMDQVRAVMEAFGVGSGGLPIEFPWHDSFQAKDVTTQKCEAFEEASVLFNIAAMLTALAADQSRNEAEGLKMSFQYFIQAASIYSHIQGGLSAQLLKPISADLTVEGLTLCHATCAAQAQECFYERSVKSGASDGLLSKLAAGCVQGYKRMASAAGSKVISSSLHATWGLFAKFNVAYYTAEMELRSAMHLHKIPAEGTEIDTLAEPEVVPEERLKVGDAVGRLRKAQASEAVARKELAKFKKVSSRNRFQTRLLSTAPAGPRSHTGAAVCAPVRDRPGPREEAGLRYLAGDVPPTDLLQGERHGVLPEGSGRQDAAGPAVGDEGGGQGAAHRFDATTPPPPWI